MKEKFSLTELDVQSFSTNFKRSSIKGGESGLAGGMCTAYDCSGVTYCYICEGTIRSNGKCCPIK